MRSVITSSKSSHLETDTAVYPFDNWIDPIETEISRAHRRFIEEPDPSGARRGAGARATGDRRSAAVMIASAYLVGTKTRRGEQGHGEPGLAQGEERLGRLLDSSGLPSH